MSFTARDIKDRIVQFPHRYKLKDTSTGAVIATYDLEAVTGTVTEDGTAISANYLQPIEDALSDHETRIGDAETNINGKAPNNHASTATTYGLGTTANYGHVKTIDNLIQANNIDGTALSAYQGKILDDKVTAITPTRSTGAVSLSLPSDSIDKTMTIPLGKTPTKYIHYAGHIGVWVTFDIDVINSKIFVMADNESGRVTTGNLGTLNTVILLSIYSGFILTKVAISGTNLLITVNNSTTYSLTANGKYFLEVI